MKVLPPFFLFLLLALAGLTPGAEPAADGLSGSSAREALLSQQFLFFLSKNDPIGYLSVSAQDRTEAGKKQVAIISSAGKIIFDAKTGAVVSFYDGDVMRVLAEGSSNFDDIKAGSEEERAAIVSKAEVYVKETKSDLGLGYGRLGITFQWNSKDCISRGKIAMITLQRTTNGILHDDERGIFRFVFEKGSPKMAGYAALLDLDGTVPPTFDGTRMSKENAQEALLRYPVIASLNDEIIKAGGELQIVLSADLVYLHEPANPSAPMPAVPDFNRPIRLSQKVELSAHFPKDKPKRLGFGYLNPVTQGAVGAYIFGKDQ
jgi:hypothetical protein